MITAFLNGVINCVVDNAIESGLVKPGSEINVTYETGKKKKTAKNFTLPWNKDSISLLNSGDVIELEEGDKTVKVKPEQITEVVISHYSDADISGCMKYIGDNSLEEQETDRVFVLTKDGELVVGKSYSDIVEAGYDVIWENGVLADNLETKYNVVFFNETLRVKSFNVKSKQLLKPNMVVPEGSEILWMGTNEKVIVHCLKRDIEVDFEERGIQSLTAGGARTGGQTGADRSNLVSIEVLENVKKKKKSTKKKAAAKDTKAKTSKKSTKKKK